jgi:hypothetical protein
MKILILKLQTGATAGSKKTELVGRKILLSTSVLTITYKGCFLRPIRKNGHP